MRSWPSSRWRARSSTVGSRLRYQPWFSTVSYRRPKVSTGCRIQSWSGTRWKAAGQLHAPDRPLDAVRVMDQAEVELGLGVQAELPQRRVVRLVEALARDG